MNSKTRNKQLTILGIILAVVVVAAAGVILVSGRSSASNIDYSAIPQSRTADGAFVLGSEDAPITIVEFADFGCPHCLEYHRSTIKALIQDYVATGKARFEYRSFPTAGGALTQFAAQLSECAENQQPGAHWRAYETFYRLAETGRYNQDAGRLMAQELGLNYSQLLTCSNSASQVQTDVNFGSSLGVTGTPAVMVRYGDSAPTWLVHNGVTYNRAGVPLNVLTDVINSLQ